MKILFLALPLSLLTLTSSGNTFAEVNSLEKKSVTCKWQQSHGRNGITRGEVTAELDAYQDYSDSLSLIYDRGIYGLVNLNIQNGNFLRANFTNIYVQNGYQSEVVFLEPTSSFTSGYTYDTSFNYVSYTVSMSVTCKIR